MEKRKKEKTLMELKQEMKDMLVKQNVTEEEAITKTLAELFFGDGAALRSPAPRDENGKIIRPPATYNQSKSPYGIASEFHGLKTDKDQ